MKSAVRRVKLWELLSREQLDLLHLRSLDLLEVMGIQVTSAEALQILKKAGAEVDAKTKVARIPSYLVEEGLRRCQRPVRLAGRIPENDFVLDGEHVYVCTDGTGTGTWDFETGQRRPSRKEDVAMSARLVDALEYFHMYYPLVTPLEVPQHAHTLHEFEASFHNTAKHVMSGATYQREEALLEIEMAAAIQGGKEALRRRPLISGVICTTSPMILGPTTDAALAYVRAGVPPALMPMPLIGASGPITEAGSILIGNAQVLAINTVLQLAAPGCPVMYSECPMAMEVKSGSFSGAFPAANLVAIGFIQLARRYRIPMFAGFGWGTSSKLPDSQAAYEKAMGATLCYLSGADITSGPGLLEGWMVLSYEQLLVDYEIYTMILDHLGGVDVTDETLAWDTILKVGHEGHYLGQKHTLDHFKETWIPMISDARPYPLWEADGKKSAIQVAHERVKELLAKHQVVPLDPKVAEELRRIVKRGEETIPH